MPVRIHDDDGYILKPIPCILRFVLKTNIIRYSDLKSC